MRGITYCMVAALVCFGAAASARADIMLEAPASGAAEIEVDVTTGVITIVGNAVDLTGYSITSASGSLIADGDGVAAPFMFYLSDTADEVTAAILGADVSLPPPLLLDARFDITGTQDLAFEYGLAGSTGGAVPGDVIYVPEPVTLTLLGMGGLALLRRRRR